MIVNVFLSDLLFFLVGGGSKREPQKSFTDKYGNTLQ